MFLVLFIELYNAIIVFAVTLNRTILIYDDTSELKKKNSNNDI